LGKEDSEKQTVRDKVKYEWQKFRVFTRWKTQPSQIAILVFDADSSLQMQMAEMLTIKVEDVKDPFWVYEKLVGLVVDSQDAAVWTIRDYVRSMEKEEHPKGKPEHDYRHLHDLARHTIHVTETLDVALGTMNAIVAKHEAFQPEVADKTSWETVHDRLLFYRQMLESLRCRSNSNSERLLNEIQLAFHVVLQYDSGTSVTIAKATREDSEAMKTIATLTLVFLPPTFVSTIFGMTFFNFDADMGWSVSDMFWVYWACAIPMTLTTIGLWYKWPQLSAWGRADKERISLHQRRQLVDAKRMLDSNV
jgi:Mg2+ and Co2+ transporter CorA